MGKYFCASRHFGVQIQGELWRRRAIFPAMSTASYISARRGVRANITSIASPRFTTRGRFASYTPPREVAAGPSVCDASNGLLPVRSRKAVDDQPYGEEPGSIALIHLALAQQRKTTAS